ncbi:DUF1116 domain-containing protein [Actinomadura decatromicini]|uniref:DUF1116 domain-containing protein n=1 Tax=Actinomadura decatromicini TaxID=2604572 RepID=A0A5D3FTK2_9ACTN|nr:DUF1116 domain-containing protein [Actinomadura decatromicini]TYK51424.1 DUF1116 domain-containing protein [Actinomadura decatromicini]
MTTVNESVSAEADPRRAKANAEALERLVGAEPVLVGVAAAGDVVPGMTPTTILTSGAPLEWPEYTGGQRRAILYGAVYEGLAGSVEDAEAKIDRGEIQVRSTQQHACIGSVAGIYTASMPVFVVRDEAHGNTAFCNFYEGKSRYRLNYGSYDQEVADGLRWLETTMAPVLAESLSDAPIPLKPMMARALRLGDELHSRNTAATLLLQRELTPRLFTLATTPEWRARVEEVMDFFLANDYTFLRLSMAAAKATADAAHGVEHSSLLTGMAINCREFAVRVSGLGDEWFRGGHPELQGRFFDGFTEADAEWIGGESCVTETVGLGGMAQACAPSLMDYQGGTFQAMLENNEAMYEITSAEHPDYKIPAFGFRGTPVGVDLHAVIATGRTPLIDGGLAGRSGGQIGAGLLRPRIEAFTAAAAAYAERYPTSPAS